MEKKKTMRKQSLPLPINISETCSKKLSKHALHIIIKLPYE